MQPVSSRLSEEQSRLETSDGDIAIIGMDGLFAGSSNLDQFWENLLHQTDLITEIPPDRFDYQKWYDPDPDAADAIYCKWGSFIEDVDKFDAPFFNISPHEADWMAPQLRLLLQSLYTTAEDTGYADKMRGTDTGIFVGVCFQDYADKIKEMGLPIDPYLGTGNSYSVLANRASFIFDLTGPSMPIDTACSSSLFALHAACTAIRSRECEMAFVGGVNLILSSFRHRYFCNIGALSPTGRCHTFDAAADGYVPGEAIVSVLLKPLSKAEADGDRIHAVIKGSAALHGGYTPSLTAPSVRGEANVILKAWESVNLDPATLTYIEAHGTGTPLGDPIEINALKKAFQQFTDQEHFCAIGSAKAHIGHAEGAAGLVGVVKAILQMQHRQIPAMPGFKEQNPYIELENSPLYINREPIPWESTTQPRRAGISSFGFSGSYAHVVVEEYIPPQTPEPPTSIGQTADLNLAFVPLSAKDENRLRQMSQNLATFLTHASENGTETQPAHRLEEIAYTLQVGRAAMDHRVIFSVRTIADLQEKLVAFSVGSENIDGCISGRVRKEDVLLFEADEDLKTLVDTWLVKGKMEKVAQLWVRGLELDWLTLYPEQRPTRITLPTYPFAKERYWISAKYANIPLVEEPEPAHLSCERLLGSRGVATQESTESPAVAVEEESTVQQIVDYLMHNITTITGIPKQRLDVHEEVQNYGFDSIVITKLVGDLETIIGKKDPSIFFSSNTIHGIAETIFGKYKDDFSAHDTLKLSTAYQTAANPANVPSISSVAEEIPKQNESLQSTINDKLHVAVSSRVDGERATTENDVAIIGISGQYPQADNLTEFFENLKRGADCIEEIPKERWDYTSYLGDVHDNGKMRAKWGGFINHINEFDFENFNISYREALVTHPEERLLLQQAWHCFESAGYNPLTWVEGQSAQTGVYIGASFHEYPQLVAERNQHNGTYLPFTAQTFTYANRLSYFYNLTGPSVTLDTACSSSLYAIFEAYNDIRNGVCDTALAGGVNLNLHPSKFIFLSEYNFLSLDGKCRAFADGGDGYVPGEGIGLVLLKRLDQAIQENDHILAVIKGASAGNDGRTNGFTVPNPEAQSAIIKDAIQNSGIDPATISCIECHGTGTALGDPIEIAALTDAFRNYTSNTQYCAVSSVKSNIGHLEAAAGIAQLSKVILQFQNKLLFPNLMHSPRVNQNIQFADTPFYVQRDLAVWRSGENQTSRRASISSFGAGGTNVHMILEEYSTSPIEEDATAENRYHLVPFSADSKEQLRQIVRDTYVYLSSANLNIFNSVLTVNNIAGTLQQGRATKKCRLAVVCDGRLNTLLDALEDTINFLQTNDASPNRKNIIFGIVEKQLNEIPGSISFDEFADERKLSSVAQQWVQGHDIHWDDISEHYDKVVLPGYRFKNKIVELARLESTTADLAAQEDTQIVDRQIAGVDSGHNTVRQHVLHVFERVLGVLADDFDEHGEFSDYGIDSIMASRIHAELSNRYQNLDMFVLFEYNTVAKLTDHIVDEHLTDPKSSTPETDSTPIPSPDEMEEIGDIRNLKFGGDNPQTQDDTIPMRDYIASYKKHGGKLDIQRMDVRIPDNISIEVVACGEGETVVLLPPFNSSAIVWIQQLIFLSKYYRVLVIHYPGMGQSEWLDEMHSFSDLATVVVDVLNKLAASQFLTHSQAMFVGWSLGGFLAQTIATEFPDHAQKLILVSTTAISWSSDEYQISGEEFSQKSAQEFRDNYRRLPTFVRKMPAIQQWHKEGRVEKFVVGTTVQRVMDRYFLMIARFRHLDVASDIRIKTYLLSGGDDELMPAKFARRLHEQIKDSVYYEVEGGKHFLSLFNKDIVNKKLREWLRQ